MWWRRGESRAFAYANPHRLRPAIAVLARSLKTLRVFFTLAPCIEFDSPQDLTAIKKQVDTYIYLLVPCGGGAENRTPVHDNPAKGVSKLSRCSVGNRQAHRQAKTASCRFDLSPGHTVYVPGSNLL